MGAPCNLIDDNYKAYTRMLRDLHALFVAGKGESDEAEALRDHMDHVWELLTPEQVELVKGLAADLNWLLLGPKSNAQTSARAVEENVADLERAEQLADWLAVLKCVRRLSSHLPHQELAELRGKAWQALGDDDSARLFQDEASKLEPANGAISTKAGRSSRAD